MRLLQIRTLLRVLKHAACVLYLHGPLGLTSYKTRPEQATHAQLTRQLECTHSQLPVLDTIALLSPTSASSTPS